VNVGENLVGFRDTADSLMFIVFFACSLSMKVEAVLSSKTSVNFYYSIVPHIME
jgi:hypothetical protein